MSRLLLVAGAPVRCLLLRLFLCQLGCLLGGGQALTPRPPLPILGEGELRRGPGCIAAAQVPRCLLFVAGTPVGRLYFGCSSPCSLRCCKVLLALAPR